MKNSSCDVFALLLYKKYLCRKRHWILTGSLQIVIPIILLVNIWNIGSFVSPNTLKSSEIKNKSEQKCKAKLFIIPNNPFTTKLSERMNDCLIKKMTHLTYNDSITHACKSAESETNTFDTEQDLLEVYQSFYPTKRDSWSGYAFTATVIFQNESEESFTRNLNYKLKITMPLPSELFDEPVSNAGDHVYEKGYAAFQICIDEEFIKMKTSKVNLEVEIDTEEMPKPIFVKPDIIHEKFTKLFGFVAVVAFLVPFCVETFFISNEQFAGVNMLLLLNNVSHYLNLMSWLISGLIVSLLYTIPITFILSYHSTADMQPFLQYGNPFIFFIMIILNVAHLITLGIHVSIYFTMPFFSIVTIFLMYASSTTLLIFGIDENIAGIMSFIGIICPNLLLFRASEEFNYYEKMERSVKGIGWSNMFKVGNSSYGMQGSVGMILIFTIVGIIFHFTMANYVYAINPGKYGIKRSPFSFIKFFMNRMKLRDCNKVENFVYNNNNSKFFEPIVQENIMPEIRIRKLTKSYRISSLNRVKKCALRDVSIDILGKQTTVLFGYSGSGKTTLLSILTGASHSSEGFVFINGKDVKDKSENLSINVGVCLQKNILFTDLSIFEQLSFFNMLRHSDKSKCVVDAEVTSLLAQLKLTDKSNALPSELSIAQKRRLSLGMALIGNPKILILDEPTLGLDKDSKSYIWDMILKMHGEKTIIISTRDLEEANVLGDRVAILHEGELKCYGSPNYLKNSLGQGNLQVTISTGSQCELEKIIDYFDPKSKVKEISHGKIILNVPDNNDLPDSLDKILHDKENLSVTGIKVANTNLAKVYLEATRHNSGLSSTREFSGNTSRLDINRNVLKALICKKAIYTINNVGPILIMITMFFASLLCASLILTSESASKRIEIPVKLDLYHNVTAYYSFNDNTGYLACKYIETVKERHGKALAIDITQEYLCNEFKSLAYQETAFDYTYHSLVAAEFLDFDESKVKAVALYNAYRARFTLPISINLVSNALLKSIAGVDHSIETTYEELDVFKEDIDLTNFKDNAKWNGHLVASLIVLFLYPAMALFVVHPLRESSSNVKLLQKMAGVSSLTYWGIMFAFDFVIFFAISIFFVVKFVLMDIIFGLDMFGWKETFIQLMLFILFAVNTLPLIYAFSYWNKSASFTIGLLSLLPLSLVFLNFTVFIRPLSYFFKIHEFSKMLQSFRNGLLLLIPYGSFYQGQMSFFNSIKVNSECKKLTNLANERVCHLTQCCSMTCADGVCSDAVTYFNNFEEHVSLEKSVLFMCLTPILYFIILCILEYNLIPKLFRKRFVTTLNHNNEAIEEQVKKVKHEIAFEASKVRENTSNGIVTNGNLNTVENGTEASTSTSHENNDYEFFVFELKKFYGNVTAVKDISFGIRQNECFGLLGASCAGKSTILKMITGEEIADHGIIHLHGESYLKNVGYCPQNVALIKTLNAYDHLRLFARLRGIPDRIVDRQVTKWIDRFQLNDCASEPSETYSTSNKKRLNIAMALIGHPKLVLIDEPTKNLDPITKLFLWKIIQSRQAAGLATLLTSNSMEECLTLCSNFGIMESGKMIYIGSSDDLKQRFGIGYEIQLKLKYETSKHEIDALKSSMIEVLPCEIIGENPEYLKFHVLPVEITWRQMYDSLFEMKAEYSCIEEFNVITSSYEQLFSVFIKPADEANSH